MHFCGIFKNYSFKLFNRALIFKTLEKGPRAHATFDESITAFSYFPIQPLDPTL